MEIGKPEREITIVPDTEPVPQRPDHDVPEPSPVREPHPAPAVPA
jgi:hypothetical protein